MGKRWDYQSLPNFCWAKKIIFNAYLIPSGKHQGEAGHKSPFHLPPSGFASGVWLYQNSCCLTSNKKQRVNGNSLLCCRTLVEGRREFCLSNSLGISNSPNFDCCTLNSQSWLRRSPILTQVGTICINVTPISRLWVPRTTFPLRWKSKEMRI